MLTAKQDVLSRIVAAYMRSADEIPSPGVMVRLRSISDYIVDYGEAVPDKTIFPVETPLVDLELGKRAQACLRTIAKQNGLAGNWAETKTLPVCVISNLVFEEALTTMKNVGANTISEIKRAFGLCGLQMKIRQAVLEVE